MPNQYRLATQFTTGSSAGGYGIEQVRIPWFSMPSGLGASLIRVTVHEDDSGSPGSEVFRFNATSGLQTGPKTYAFEAPDGALLDAETSYHLMVKANGAAIGSLQTTESENAHLADGWSLGGSQAAPGDTFSDSDANLKFDLQAQEGRAPETLVSNIDKSSSASAVGTLVKINATSFTTGSRPKGYAISSVTLSLGTNTMTSDDVEITIREGYRPNRPGNTIYTFTNPSDLSAGDRTFTAPTPFQLDPDTTYFLAIDGEGHLNNFKRTASNEQSGKTGWDIAAGSSTLTGTTWLTNSLSIKFTLTGLENEEYQFSVANAEETGSSNKTVAAGDQLATSFTTGHNPDGYTFNRVTILWNSIPTGTEGSKIKVAIARSSGDDPGSDIGTLTSPKGTSTALTGKLHSFSHATGLSLTANTTYFVRVEADGVSIGQLKLANSDQQIGRVNWSIGDDSRFKQSGATEWAAQTGSMKMSIFTTPKGDDRDYKGDNSVISNFEEFGEGTSIADGYRHSRRVLVMG